MYRLISATPSPYARKVRIALAEKGLPFELSTEVPWHSTTETPRYNPLEKLPVLVLPDGDSVYESTHILDWLELRHPSPPLLPPDVDGILLAKKLDVLCNGVCDAVVLSLFERMRDGGGSQPWLERQRRKIEGGTREIARLIGSREWAVGNHISIGDIAAVTAVGYLQVRFAELPVRDLYPELVRYCERLDQRPSFAQSRPFAQTISERVV